MWPTIRLNFWVAIGLNFDASAYRIPAVTLVALAESMEVGVALKGADFAEAERAAAHLKPKYPYANMAGMIGIVTGVIVLFVYWGVVSSGLPVWLALVLSLSAAYGIGPINSNSMWKPYYREYYRLIDEKAKMDA